MVDIALSLTPSPFLFLVPPARVSIWQQDCLLTPDPSNSLPDNSQAVAPASQSVDDPPPVQDIASTENAENVASAVVDEESGMMEDEVETNGSGPAVMEGGINGHDLEEG